MTVAFLVWYFAFVFAAIFAPHWMATPVIGNINIGIIFGLLQFVSTGLITWLYVRHANRKLDPLARGDPHRDGGHVMTASLIAASTVAGKPAVNMAIFVLFVAVTLVIVIRAARANKSAADYYAGGRSFTGGQNGTAIAGDYLSAALVPGHHGCHRGGRLRRFPCTRSASSSPGSWRCCWSPNCLRNTGRVHDGRRARLPAAAGSGAHRRGDLDAGGIAVLPAGPDGRGAVVWWRCCSDIKSRTGQSLVIAVVGVLMIVYVLSAHEGHHLGTDHQGGGLLIAGAALMTVMVLAKFGLNFQRSWAWPAEDGLPNEAGSLKPRRPGAGRLLRRFGPPEDQPSRPGAGARHRACCTCWMRFTRVPTAKEHGGPWCGRSPDRRLLPNPGAGLRRVAIVGPDCIPAAAGGR